jgi:hypothetical protein
VKRVARSSRSAGVALLKHPFDPGDVQLQRPSKTGTSIQTALPNGMRPRLAPGQFLEMRARLYVHMGSGVETRLGAVAEGYAAELDNNQS